MPTQPQYIPDLKQWLRTPLPAEKLLVPPGSDHFQSTRHNPKTLAQIRAALEDRNPSDSRDGADPALVRRPQSIWLEEWHWDKTDVPLDVRSKEFHCELVFVRCRFASHVIATDARFLRHVTMIGCIFEGSLTLAGAHFEGGVTFHECYFGVEDEHLPESPQLSLPLDSSSQYELGLASPVPSPTEETKPKELPLARLQEAPARSRSAWWPGLRVVGILRVDRCDFAGSLNLAESRIEGPLLLRGVRIGSHRRTGGDKRRGRLHLRQIRVEGDIDLSPHVFERQFTKKRPSSIFGSIVLSACDVGGRVDVQGVRVRGRLHLPLSHIRDRLLAGAWVHPHDKKRQHVCGAFFRGRNGVAVRLADAVIEHGVWMDGARLAGQLNAKNAKIGGDFYLRAAREEDPDREASHGKEKDALKKDRLRQFFSRIYMPIDDPHDAIRMPGATIVGSLELSDARIRGTVNFDNLSVGGDLILTELRQQATRAYVETKWEIQRKQERAEATTPEDRAAVLAQEITLKLRTVQVGRTLDARAVQTAGGIGAHGLRVGGDCHFGAWQPRSPDGIPLVTDPREWHQGIYRGVLNLTGARVDGDLRFCGGIFHEPVLAEGVEVGNRCDFTGAVFCAMADFDDAKIHGELLAGHREWHDGVTEGGTLPVSRWTPAGTWFLEMLTLRRAVISGDFRFEYLTLGRIPPIAWTDDLYPHFERAIARHQPDPRKTRLNLRLAVIAGAWTTPRDPHSNSWTSPRHQEDAPWTEHFLDVCGSVHAEHTQIKGRLQLAWVKITGDLKLENAEIGGDVVLHRSEIHENLDLSSARVQGDSFPSETEERDSREDHSHATAATTADVLVRGKLKLRYATLQNVRLVLRHEIPGEIDLLQARVARLEICGKLPIPEPPFIEMRGLHFEELETSKLEGADEHAFARHLCWRRWLYTGKTYPTQAAFFLRQMIEMDAGLYTRVEDWLRSRNLEEEANLVYLERRLQELEHGFPTAFVCALLGWLLWPLALRWSRRPVSRKAQRRIQQAIATTLGQFPSLQENGEPPLAIQFNHAASRLDLHATDGQMLNAALRKLRLQLEARGVSRDCLVRPGEQKDNPGASCSCWIDGPLRNFTMRAAIVCLRIASPEGRLVFQHPTLWGTRKIGSGAEIRRELGRRLFDWPRVFFARLRLLLVGDGVRPQPLIFLWLVLFFFSWLAVFSSYESVEHPATFLAPAKNFGATPELARPTPWADPQDGHVFAWQDAMGHPEPDKWDLSDGFWVALNLHVPLVQFMTRNEWEPASDPGAFAFLRWRPSMGMQYDTYAGLMQIFGWLSVPLLLTSLSGLFKKRD